MRTGFIGVLLLLLVGLTACTPKTPPLVGLAGQWEDSDGIKIMILDSDGTFAYGYNFGYGSDNRTYGKYERVGSDSVKVTLPNDVTFTFQYIINGNTINVSNFIFGDQNGNATFKRSPTA